MKETEEKKKKFITYEQMIIMLADEKGLVISDLSYAQALLKKHSYYGLISGYKKPFKSASGKYKKNTRIEDIYALYCFDDRLRDIVLRNILIIEKHVKSLISYAFCETFGDDQTAYLDATKYHYVPSKQSGINRLIAQLSEIVNNPEAYSYIKYQKKEYYNIPLWVMMKALTIGNVSKMYSFLTPTVQVKIAKEFKAVFEHELVGMLNLLSRFRNVCAHNERLFNYKYNKGAIDDMYAHDYLGIKGMKFGKSDLFAVVICFKYLLEENEFQKLMDELESVMNQLFNDTKQIQKPQLKKMMGFPINWKEIKNAPHVKEIIQ